MKNQKGSAVVWAIIILAILVVAGGIYFYLKNTSPSTTNPSITVILPTSGETLQQGQSYTIAWSDKNIPSDALFTVAIVNGTSASIANPNSQIATGLPATTTSYTWTVRANPPTQCGKYSSPDSCGWGVGMGSFPKNITQFLGMIFGVKEAYASSNQYFVAVSEYSPGATSNIVGLSGVFTINAPVTTTAPTSTSSQEIISASPDNSRGGIPAVESMTISSATSTYFPIGSFDLKSQNGASTLHSLSLVMNTGTTSPNQAVLSRLFGDITMEASDGRTYQATISSFGGGCQSEQCGPSGGNPVVSFNNLNITLPVNESSEFLVFATIPSDTDGSLNGQVIQFSLVGSGSMISTVDSNNSSAPPDFLPVNGSQITLIDGSK